MNAYYIAHQLFIMLLAVVVILAEVLPFTAGTSQGFRKTNPGYPFEIGWNMNASLKIIIVAVVFGLIGIVFFVLYLRLCLSNSYLRNRPPAPLSIVNSRARSKYRCGLDKNVIESFPVFFYSDIKELKMGRVGLECAVCLSEFADDERLRFLPKCHHVFHPECIDGWLASHTTCPVCRTDHANVIVTNVRAESESRHELTHLEIEESSQEIQNHNHNPIHVVEERAASNFSRSHSTGHSLVAPGENCERYTLRLPDEVIVTLKRANSCGNGGLRCNPDQFLCPSGQWNITMTRIPGFDNIDTSGKGDPGQSSSSSSVGLPV